MINTKIKKTQFILIWLYIFIIIFFHIIKLLGYNYKLIIFYFFPILPISVKIITSIVISYFITKFIFCISDKLNIKKNKNSIKYFIIPLIIGIVIFSIYYLMNFPGLFSYDCIDQLNIANSPYNSPDWHPFLHTFLFYYIPIKLFNNSMYIVLLQIIYFVLAFSYMAYTLHKNGMPKWLYYLMLVTVYLSPMTYILSVVPLKDTAMSIFCMILISYYVNIVCTKGDWLLKKTNCILLSIITVICLIIRHNSVLFILPLMINIILYKRNIKLYLILVIILTFLIKVPLYNHYKIYRAPERVTETSGMLLTIINDAVIKYPDDIDEDIKEFAFKVTPEEQLQKNYKGTFNSIKWLDDTDRDVIEEYGNPKILLYTIKVIAKRPQLLLSDSLYTTSVVWQIFGDYKYFDYKYFLKFKKENNISNYMVDNIGSVFYAVIDFFNNSSINFLFISFGFYNSLLIILALIKVTKIKSYKPLLHIIPIVIYDIGTMCLLSGLEYRFFYFTQVISIPLIYLILIERSKDDEEKSNHNRCRTSRFNRSV